MTEQANPDPWIRISSNLSRTWSKKNDETPVKISVNDSIELKPTERIAILGPSGCGKSTLLRILGTLDRPSSGQVEYSLPNDKSLTWKPKGKAANVMSLRRSFGFVYQDARLLPYLTALENILVNPLLQLKDAMQKDCLKHTCDHTKELSLTDKEIDKRYIDRLSGLNLKQIRSLAKKLGDKVTQYPHELSGGEQSRVALLRALSHNPRILFADEPTSAIDRKTGKLVMGTMRDWACNDQDRLLVFVTHSAWEALEYGNRWLGFPEEGGPQYQLHECNKQEIEQRLGKRIRMLEGVLKKSQSSGT